MNLFKKSQVLVSVVFCLFFYIQDGWGAVGTGCLTVFNPNPTPGSECTSYTQEATTSITGGTRTLCQCRHGGPGGAVTTCVPDETACYDVNSYPRIICNTGYYVSGMSCKLCEGCTNCVSDVDWVNLGGGRQEKKTKTCNCNVCNTTIAVRCAPGYYGSGFECTACPSGGTSLAGTTSITGCYLPAGTTGSDSTGSFEYTNSCYYSN